MNIALGVLNSVNDNLMAASFGQSIVGLQRAAEQCGTNSIALADMTTKVMFCGAWEPRT
jgi:hypothetical protein